MTELTLWQIEKCTSYRGWVNSLCHINCSHNKTDLSASSQLIFWFPVL